jgi:hypothetical protein
MNVPNNFIGNLEPNFTRLFFSQGWSLSGLKRNNHKKYKYLYFMGKWKK